MKKYLHFEGLRGLAALVVFLAHFRLIFYQNIDAEILTAIGFTNQSSVRFASNLLKILYDGTLPVFIFWFMSAFVISIKLFDPVKNINNTYLIEASVKRYFRLAIPVFVTSLICFFLLKTKQFYNIQLADYSGPAYQKEWLKKWYQFDESFFSFLKTTLVDVFASANSNYNMVLWTMSPELLGSLLCFGLFAVLGKNKNRFIIYIAALIFMFFAGIHELNYFSYFVFICGIMWCDVLHSSDQALLKNEVGKIITSKILPIILLLLGFGITGSSELTHNIHPAIFYFFDYPVKAIGITLLISNSGLLKKVFSIKPLTFLGKISFALYLLHIPIMFSIGAYIFIYAGIDPLYKVGVLFFILTAMILSLSYLFEIIVDKWAINVSDKIGKYFTK